MTAELTLLVAGQERSSLRIYEESDNSCPNQDVSRLEGF